MVSSHSPSFWCTSNYIEVDILLNKLSLKGYKTEANFILCPLPFNPQLLDHFPLALN